MLTKGMTLRQEMHHMVVLGQHLVWGQTWQAIRLVPLSV